MPILTVNGMATVENNIRERATALQNLTSRPFSINNEEQLTELKKYINQFELSVNKMYFFQGLSSGLTLGAGSWLVGRFLPIPNFVTYFITMTLYAGAAGHILQNFSLKDFYSQLEEMKVLYNWCLKKGHPRYDENTDNSAIISDQAIQRFIKLIAPLCSVEFMLAWRKITDQPVAQNSVWSHVSSAFSYFSSAPRSHIDFNRLQDLKVSVEQRELDVNAFKGFHQSIEYFTTNTHFRELLTAKIKQPFENISGLIPDPIRIGSPQ